jgi:hypothetical protein
MISCPECGDYFHESHLREWLHIKRTCPMCRRNITLPNLKILSSQIPHYSNSLKKRKDSSMDFKKELEEYLGKKPLPDGLDDLSKQKECKRYFHENVSDISDSFLSPEEHTEIYEKRDKLEEMKSEILTSHDKETKSLMFTSLNSNEISYEEFNKKYTKLQILMKRRDVKKSVKKHEKRLSDMLSLRIQKNNVRIGSFSISRFQLGVLALLLSILLGTFIGKNTLHLSELVSFDEDPIPIECYLKITVKDRFTKEPISTIIKLWNSSNHVVETILTSSEGIAISINMYLSETELLVDIQTDGYYHYFKNCIVPYGTSEDWGQTLVLDNVLLEESPFYGE